MKIKMKIKIQMFLFFPHFFFKIIIFILTSRTIYTINTFFQYNDGDHRAQSGGDITALAAMSFFLLHPVIRISCLGLSQAEGRHALLMIQNKGSHLCKAVNRLLRPWPAVMCRPGLWLNAACSGPNNRLNIPTVAGLLPADVPTLSRGESHHKSELRKERPVPQYWKPAPQTLLMGNIEGASVTASFTDFFFFFKEHFLSPQDSLEDVALPP